MKCDNQTIVFSYVNDLILNLFEGYHAASRSEITNYDDPFEEEGFLQFSHSMFSSLAMVSTSDIRTPGPLPY